MVLGGSVRCYMFLGSSRVTLVVFLWILLGYSGGCSVSF